VFIPYLIFLVRIDNLDIHILFGRFLSAFRSRLRSFNLHLFIGVKRKISSRPGPCALILRQLDCNCLLIFLFSFCIMFFVALLPSLSLDMSNRLLLVLRTDDERLKVRH
jgi:hypothetical protein